MEKRSEKILDAAIAVFTRYGVKRAAMNDIAAEAGIARQTLYNTYSNKDEVLQAALRLYADRAIAAIEAGLESTTDLGGQLDLVFKYLAVMPYKQLSETPNAEDIIEGFNTVGQQEIAANNDRFRGVVERILAPHEPAIAAAGLTLDQLSDFVQRSASAAKHSANNHQHLQRLLDALKVSVLSIVKAV